MFTPPFPEHVPLPEFELYVPLLHQDPALAGATDTRLPTRAIAMASATFFIDCPVLLLVVGAGFSWVFYVNLHDGVVIVVPVVQFAKLANSVSDVECVFLGLVPSVSVFDRDGKVRSRCLMLSHCHLLS